MIWGSVGVWVFWFEMISAVRELLFFLFFLLMRYSRLSDPQFGSPGLKTLDIVVDIVVVVLSFLDHSPNGSAVISRVRVPRRRRASAPRRPTDPYPTRRPSGPRDSPLRSSPVTYPRVRHRHRRRGRVSGRGFCKRALRM